MDKLEMARRNSMRTKWAKGRENSGSLLPHGFLYNRRRDLRGSPIPQASHHSWHSAVHFDRVRLSFRETKVQDAQLLHMRIPKIQCLSICRRHRDHTFCAPLHGQPNNFFCWNTFGTRRRSDWRKLAGLSTISNCESVYFEGQRTKGFFLD